MALKDEPNPKYTFPGAGTSLLKSYKKLAAGTEIISFLHFSRLLAAASWLLAAALLPLLLLLLLLLDSQLPLPLPRPLLQLPAAKHHGPKGRTESKIYVSRGRNVPSEILQKACCWCGNISFYFFKRCWLLLAGG